MATQPDRLVNIFKQGVSTKETTRPGYAQNMLVRGDAWWVRAGFRQIAQVDADLPMPPLSGSSEQYGIDRVFGFRSMVAANGHEQLLTLVSAKVSTCDFDYANQQISLMLLVVLDVETGRSWQEPLTRHMAQASSSLPEEPFQRGQYQSNGLLPFDLWQRAPQRVQPVWWCEADGAMLFGCEGIGAWRYSPIDVLAARSRNLVPLAKDGWASWYSESSAVVPLIMADGEFRDGIAYLSASLVGRFVDAANVEGRVAFATKRQVWFADRGRPNCIRVTEFIEVPSGQEIVGIAWRGDSLWIWTFTERFIYVPTTTQGTLAQGFLQRASNDDGLISCAAKVQVGNELQWAGPTQIWTSTATTGVRKLGAELDQLFDPGLANPLSSFLTATGSTTMADAQPRSWLNWLEVDGAHAVYHRPLGLTLFVLPQQYAALVTDGKNWSVWNFETLCKTAGVVESGRTFPTPWLASTLEGLFLAAGPEYQAIQDYAYLAGNPAAPLNETDSPGSLIVAQYGGPGFDRSVQITEDNRHGPGYLEMLQQATDGYFFIDKPTVLDPGTVLPGGAVVAEGDVTYPVSIVLTDTTPSFNRFDLVVNFDNVHWAPLTMVAGAQFLDLVWPSERIPSSGSYNPGSAATIGVAEARVVGNQLIIRWDNTVGAPWDSFPYMNLFPGQKYVLFYLTMRPLQTNVCTASAGWQAVTAAIDNGLGPVNMYLFGWHYTKLVNKHDSDDVAQAVDWLMQSIHLEVPQVQIRLRGLWLKAQSQGRAATEVVSAWPLGLLNTVIGSDWKQWSSQIVDWSDGTASPDLSQQVGSDGLRTRMRTAALVQAKRTFNGSATWGDHTDPTAGNYLVDDPEVDEVAISDSVKGEYVSAMLFGFVRAASERLAIVEARAALLIEGPRRRWGR